MTSPFRASFSRDIFYNKYAHNSRDSWRKLATRLVDDVCGTFQGTAEPLLSPSELSQLTEYIVQMKFIPGGRYLYYAGRPLHAWNNCYLLKGEEDSREEWGRLTKRASDCLMVGGGIGIDYSIFRHKGAVLKRTGGLASGPLPLMNSINEIGRNVMQGGSRRSAIYASLNWQHKDIHDFLKIKNWHNMPIGKLKKSNGQPYTLADAKRDDFNFPAPLDMTNISSNYDDAFLEALISGIPSTFLENCRQALMTGEPGFSFNFGAKQNETLRNAPVSGATPVLTRHGYRRVEEIVGVPTDLWTGKQWATATFKKTGSKVPVVKVTYVSGDYKEYEEHIVCDPSHEFIVDTGLGIIRVPAEDLQEGDKLHTSMPDGFVKRDAFVYFVGPAGNEDVFCCDVGVEEHSFCAESVIVSNCTEVTSEDDSDVCNLGSVNLAAIDSLSELADVTKLGSKFLLCGTVRADLPYDKVRYVREKNRRLGLGLMGIHEWLLKNQLKYEVSSALRRWLEVWRDYSVFGAVEAADKLSVSIPVAFRAIAPTGSIGILAATTTGIEPLFAVAYKRRYLTGGTHWKYQYVVDATAQYLIDTYGLKPDEVETAASLASDPERRIKFQADIQDYVDMSISSTINLPAWGSDHNNEDSVKPFATTLAKYAPRLRGFTAYPDGSRGGQPLTPVLYDVAVKNLGEEFDEHVKTHDICDITGGGTCGS